MANESIMRMEPNLDLGSNKSGPVGTRTSSVYELIRSDIVSGRLLPGEKLRIEALRERYSLGGSPIREALNRLSSEGLVSQHDQRGFGVLPVSAEDLIELTRTRMLINEIVLRESLLLGGVDWEENVVLAFHRLSRVRRHIGDNADTPNPDWEKMHRHFHHALISACGSRWLCKEYETLFDLADRYRHIVDMIDHKSRDTEGEHRAIFAAAVDRNIPETIRLVNEHISLTSNQIQKFGLIPEEIAK